MPTLIVMDANEWVSDGRYRWREFSDVDILSMMHVHLMCAYRMVMGPQWRAHNETDGKTRLYYVLDGAGEISSGGQRTALRKGHLYLIPANTNRSHHCDEHMELLWCHFSLSLHTGPSVFDADSGIMTIQPDDPAKTQACFEDMAADFDNDTTSSVVARSGILLQLVAPFFATVDSLGLQRRNSAAEPFRALLDEVESRLHEPINIPTLAARMHMSPSHFSRRFSSAFGISPGRYFLRRRVEHAQVRLLQSNDTVETIGLDLGFCDGFHFSKAFRSVTGVAPSQYRKMIRQP